MHPNKSKCTTSPKKSVKIRLYPRHPCCKIRENPLFSAPSVLQLLAFQKMNRAADALFQGDKSLGSLDT